MARGAKQRAHNWSSTEPGGPRRLALRPSFLRTITHMPLIYYTSTSGHSRRTRARRRNTLMNMQNSVRDPAVPRPALTNYTDSDRVNTLIQTLRDLPTTGHGGQVHTSSHSTPPTPPTLLLL